MKKRILIGGLALLLAGGAITAVLLADNARTEQIKAVMHGENLPSALQKEWLDMDGNGTVNGADLLLAKADALLHRGSAAAFYSAEQARQLGRTAFHADTGTLWCSLSGSGIEFDVSGESCEIELAADSAYTGGESTAARYAVYVDDTEQETGQLLSETQIVKLAIQPTVSRVRLVKLSESAQSALGIRTVRVSGAAASFSGDIPAKAHRIEFIGDSITCGYGVDGVYGKDVFKTANENVTKAYAYLTAQALDADYSMVCYSGHGIISGYTGNGRQNKNQLVPKYYGQVGHSSATVEETKKIYEDKWDFSVQNDLIVINLGTNDSSYTGSEPEKQKEFAAGYTEFLKTVREKNPDAPILCTLGIMGQTLCDAVDLAVMNYTAETGDTNIRTFRFDMQSDADGYAVDWHPSAVTHQKAADALTAYIREWLGW